jgi:tryptophan-rich sensory protein
MGWYENLRKPSWAPPSSWFGPVWTTIYILYILYGACIVYYQRGNQVLWLLYVVGWIVNLGWPLLFRQSTSIASPLYIVFLLAIILSLFIYTLRLATPFPWASILLVPYILWLIVASTLGFFISAWNS